jgi:hypothetical protein
MLYCFPGSKEERRGTREKKREEEENDACMLSEFNNE